MGSPLRAVAEAPFRLEANGHGIGSWTCTPARLEALAAGRLLAEGYVRAREEILELSPFEAKHGAVGVRARLAPAAFAAGQAERAHRAERGCGLLHYVVCAPGLLASTPRSGAVPAPDVFPDLFRTLYESAGSGGGTGGMHAAALSDGARLLGRVEEVGRHNAVDKALGSAFLAGTDLARLGLVLSSRISGEIALKAARAGVAWVASRSIPTTLAVTLAEAAGLPLIARAPSKEPVVFGGAAAPGAAS